MQHTEPKSSSQVLLDLKPTSSEHQTILTSCNGFSHAALTRNGSWKLQWRLQVTWRLILHISCQQSTRPSGDFPGSPGLNFAFQWRGWGSVPGQGAEIPHASWPKNQSIKQKQCCNKFSIDFKNGPRFKKKKTKSVPQSEEERGKQSWPEGWRATWLPLLGSSSLVGPPTAARPCLIQQRWAPGTDTVGTQGRLQDCSKEKRVSARPRDSQTQLSPCKQQQTASPGAPGDRQSTAPPGPSQPPPAPLLQLLLRGPSTVSLRNDHKQHNSPILQLKATNQMAMFLLTSLMLEEDLHYPCKSWTKIPHATGNYQVMPALNRTGCSDINK